jgi:hypothetical protein
MVEPLRHRQTAPVTSADLPASGSGVVVLIALLGEVGTQSGGNDAVECPVGQDARQKGHHCGRATDGIASARLARRHCLGEHLGRSVSGQARIGE